MTWNRFTIRTKLQISAGIVIFFVCLLSVMGYLYFQNTTDAFEHVVKNNYGRVQTFRQIKDAVDTIDKAMLSMTLSKDPALKNAEKAVIEEARGKYREAVKEIDTVLANVKDKETKTKMSDLLNGIKGQLAEGKAHNEKLVRLAMEGNMEEAASIWSSNSRPVSNKISELFNELVSLSQKRADLRIQEFSKSSTSSKRLFGIIAALVIGCVAFGTVIITRNIVTPIRKNISVARTLAEGNLSVDVEVDREDEFGDEMKAYQTMVEKWRILISEVKSSVSDLASAARELSASADEMLTGAAAQAERTIQVSTASEEMSQSSLDIATNTTRIAESAEEMLKTAQKGNGIVDKSVGEVNEIAKTVERSSEFVQDLGTQSEKIGQIVDVINEIADQTNLLALNAAIEAARAGDAGRGFAVVADEVKKLAERTSRSTEEIGDMVASIRTGVEKAVNAMGEATQKVEVGVRLSSDAGAALGEIVGSASNLQSMVQQIAAAIEEMNATTEEIARDITEVASVTRDSSGSAERVTRSAAELTRVSTRLDNLVRGFRLEA